MSYYTIHDEADGTLLGSFYADWFPRENKRGGGLDGRVLTGLPGIKPHLGLICGT